MVLVVLAVIWGAVLFQPVMRARADARPADSIGNFRHQLGVLRRTSPLSMAPANTLRVPRYGPAPVPTYRMARNYSPEAARRARTLKRRRDVLFTLLVAMGVTLILGVLPPFRALLGLHVLCDVLFVGYVALLVRARNEAAEREMKLRFLPTAAPPENVLLLRRSAN
ncbi:MAG: hypothetical protein M3Q48_07100 [Actinomycetota bacterium]|nr:hypothetical protein [Actinomycetota bacterium]